MAKNILFIMCDQLRADYLSCYGHPFLNTPNIDKIADMGVLFNHAYCQAPLCGPSRASFYSGRYLASHGALANADPLKLGEISLGDYVLSGGEIPAITIVNGVTRLLPGTLGDPKSLDYESHNSNLLEYPQYTRPKIFRDMEVPDILLSGNHEKIRLWRERKMLERTKHRRIDLISDDEPK